MRNTGRGAPQYETFNENEEKLLKIISLNVFGLPKEFGSDAVLPKTTSTGELFIEGVGKGREI
ncbi:hypothetical protein ABEB36_009464 [Hypothenemus hampei]|uniref:Uncharacterized protein n=1 Tax=Hypothenemus hampei TaxID=57062 RepID=A0ABD1EGR8_HYPHA